MDKISNINFTGITNIGGCEFKRSKDTFSKSISMVLKDDFRGKDLAEFKSVLNKITGNSSYYINEEMPNLLNIEAFTDMEQKGGIIVNGTLVSLSDKNLPMFSYLARITRKISKMPEKDMIVNRDYVAYEAKNNLVAGGEIDSDDFVFLEQFFDRKSVKKAAKEVNDFIQVIMENYLGIR